MNAQALIVDRPIAELARQIRELCGDDDQAFVDSLDGETDTIEAARRVVRLLNEAEAHETAVKGLADTYRARAKVFAGRQVRIRMALLNFMQEIGAKTLPLPEATLSVGAGQPTVQGEPNVETLPLHLTVATRIPDKAAIKAALEAGEVLAGLSLSNAVPRLSIRMK
jgi:hypothetical protein